MIYERDLFIQKISIQFHSKYNSTQAAEPTIIHQKQVSGYYKYQASDVQIISLIDDTNFMSLTLFKNIT